ncbi:MAG: 1-deoxy-D-xylulose-5-phosphate reductoisomerase [Marinagarivorans sp.]|nr:1-deoxy-D-xylulose-5-phosphate reductoisomerase [Marinagarivorans sp.]
MVEQITVLGATGSIGVSTLDVVACHSDKYRIFALTGFSQIDKLFLQCERFTPEFAVVADEVSAVALQRRLHDSQIKTQVLFGSEALVFVAEHSDVHTVVAAIVGAAGLLPTMAAVKQGKKVLLANKESLVMAGGLFMTAVAKYHAKLLPVDSEHNAIFQCLPADFKDLRQVGISRLLLTGSGGPFRTVPHEQLNNITPEQACAHPNWSMGKKISVDSATMMNKGLEFIEACWLFGATVDQIDVVIHPQSIVHSMVEYIDGSVLCQMGMPDMRTPIAHCLGWPQRIESNVHKLDFTRMSQLEFFAPDFERFPCLKIAMDAMRMGGTYPAAINAANEEAVAAFLMGRLAFIGISRVVARVADQWRGCEPSQLLDVIAADSEARALAQQYMATFK